MQTEWNMCELQSAIMLPGGQTLYVFNELVVPPYMQVLQYVDP